MKQTIYTTYVDNDFINSEKEYLFDVYAEDNGWDSIDDIPDRDIQEYIDDILNFDWEESVHPALEEALDYPMVWSGIQRRWNGQFSGMTITHDSSEIFEILSRYDDFEIEQDDKYVYITGYDHDGGLSLTGRLLTEEGEELLDHYQNDEYNSYDDYDYEGYIRRHRLTQTFKAGMGDYNFAQALLNSNKHTRAVKQIYY